MAVTLGGTPSQAEGRVNASGYCTSFALQWWHQWQPKQKMERVQPVVYASDYGSRSWRSYSDFRLEGCSSTSLHPGEIHIGRAFWWKPKHGRQRSWVYLYMWTQCKHKLPVRCSNFHGNHLLWWGCLLYNYTEWPLCRFTPPPLFILTKSGLLCIYNCPLLNYMPGCTII